MNSLRLAATKFGRANIQKVRAAQMSTVMDHTIKITFVDKEVIDDLSLSLYVSHYSFANIASPYLLPL